MLKSKMLTLHGASPITTSEFLQKIALLEPKNPTGWVKTGENKWSYSDGETTFCGVTAINIPIAEKWLEDLKTTTEYMPFPKWIEE